MEILKTSADGSIRRSERCGQSKGAHSTAGSQGGSWNSNMKATTSQQETTKPAGVGNGKAIKPLTEKAEARWCPQGEPDSLKQADKMNVQKKQLRIKAVG